MTTDLAVECSELSKTYRLGFLGRKLVRALDGASFTVRAGEVFGLIGPNGAGKSTAIKILLNLVLPSGGTARLFGVSVRDPRARTRLGYVPESPVPYEYLTGREYLEFQGRLAGLQGPSLKKDIDRVLERVEMGPHQRLQIRRYSKGMVQRVMLAGALLGQPRLVVLDEPTSGLDPLGRRLVRELILEQRKQGASVLFCTHIISDVESLCDRVALLAGGKIRKEGAIADLVSGGKTTHEIILDEVDPERLNQSLHGLHQRLEVVGRQAIVHVADDQLQPTLARVVQDGHRVTRVRPIQFSLEETFLEAVKSSGQSVGGHLE